MVLKNTQLVQKYKALMDNSSHHHLKILPNNILQKILLNPLIYYKKEMLTLQGIFKYSLLLLLIFHLYNLIYLIIFLQFIFQLSKIFNKHSKSYQNFFFLVSLHQFLYQL